MFLFIVSMSFALLLGEAAVRLFRPQFLRPVFRERVGGVFYLRPNLHTRVYSPGEFDTQAATTIQRFRGNRLYSTFPPDGTLRVAAIGDSFTFGTGANDSEAFPEALERILTNSGRLGRVEVLNAGIPNAGPGDEALWYERWVRRFHPDVVILTIYGGNDIWDEAHDSKFVLGAHQEATPRDSAFLGKHQSVEAWLQQAVLSIPGYDFLTEHSQLLYVIRSALTGLFSGSEPEKLSAATDDSLNQLVTLKIVSEVRWLEKQVEDAGSQLVLAFVPSRDEFKSGEPQSGLLSANALEKRLAAAAAEQGILFVDFGEIISARMGSRGTSLYFNRDDHMRPDGYNLIAQELANQLVRYFQEGTDGSHRHKATARRGERSRPGSSSKSIAATTIQSSP